MNELSVVFDLLEGGAGFFRLTVENLFACNLCHGVHELGVKEALLARAGLLGTKPVELWLRVRGVLSSIEEAAQAGSRAKTPGVEGEESQHSMNVS